MRRRDGGRAVLHDQYFTKDAVVETLTKLIHDAYLGGEACDFVDSSCGTGSVVRAMQAFGHTTWAFDVDASNACAEANATEVDWLSLSADAVSFPATSCIGFNPPFGYRAKEARAFIKQAAVLAPSARFLFFISPRNLVYNVIRGEKWAPPGFRVVGEHTLPANAFYTKNGGDFHADTCLFVFSPGSKEVRASPAPLPKEVSLVRHVRSYIGVKGGSRVKLKKIFGGRREMLVRNIGAYAGHDFVLQKSRDHRRYVQMIVKVNGEVQFKRRKRNEPWSVTQHILVRFSKNVNRYAAARHIAKQAHAFREQAGGRSIIRDVLVRALASWFRDQ